MPRLPDFMPRQGVISDNPQGVAINPNAFGSDYEAAANVGGTIAGIGLQLAEKRKQAEDHDYAFNQSLEDARAIQDYSQQLRLKMPGDYKGYTEAVTKYANDRYEQNQKSAPSDSARRFYEQYSGPIVNRSIMDASAEEFKQKAINYQSNLLNGRQKSSDTLISNPNPQLAYQLVDTHSAQIKNAAGTIIDQQQASKYDFETKQHLANSLLDGLYSGALESGKGVWDSFARQGLSIIDGNDRDSQLRPSSERISNYLNPSQKAELRDKFARLIETRNKEDLTELHRMMNDNLTAALNGKSPDPALFPALDKALTNKATTPQEDIRYRTHLDAAQYVGGKIQEAATTPVARWTALRDSIPVRVEKAKADAALANNDLVAAQGPNFLASESQQLKNTFDAALNQYARELNHDPMAYAMNYDPVTKSMMKAAGNDPAKFQDAVNRAKSFQISMGVNPYNVRTISKEQSAQFGHVLNDPATSGDETAKFLMSQRQLYGDMITEVIQDAKVDKNLDLPLEAALQTRDPISMGNAINTIKFQKDMDESFKKTFQKDAKDITERIHEEVGSLITPYRQGVLQSSDMGTADRNLNDLHNMVLARATREKTRFPNMSEKDAAAAGMKFITDTYHLVQSNNTLAMVSRSTVQDPSLIKAYLDGHMSDVAFDRMNLQMPKGKNFSKLAPEDQKTMYYETLKKTGYWASDRVGGMALVYVDPDPMVGAQFAYDKNGNKIHVDFRNVPKDDMTMYWLQHNSRGFFGKLLDPNVDPAQYPTLKPNPTPSAVPDFIPKGRER